MSVFLTATELTADLLPLVRGLDYGGEPYQVELAAWLDADAEKAMGKGTRVWAYATPDGEIAGFSSLGVTRWVYPDSQSKKMHVLVIPAVALRQKFWGQPAAGAREDRYASQIMRHLLAIADQWPGELPAVGLYVHPANLAAIKLYERFHFRSFHTSYTDKTSGVTYLGYVRPITRPPGDAT